MSDQVANFKYVNELRAALKQIVRDRGDLIDAIESANVLEGDKMEFSVMLGDSLGDITEDNFADYGLAQQETIAWIKDGRPAGSAPSQPVPDHSEDPGAVIPYRKT